MKNLLNKKLKGFMGRTHALLSILVLFIFMLIPFEFFELTFWKLRENWMLFVVGIIILCGGALFPDLDNDNSSAGATTGILGSIFTTFMKSTSAVVWNIYHFRKDRKPSTQHRYLWHAPILWAGLGMAFYFGLDGGEYNILTNIMNSFKTDTFLYFLRNNALLFLFILLMFMSVLIGSSMLIGNLLKMRAKAVKYVLPVAVLFYIFSTSYSNLRVIGVCFALGATLHCIEDGFADTGVTSMIFPLPQLWRGMVWGRIRLIPMTVTTGSMVNTVIDAMAFVLDLILLIMVINKK